MTANMREALEGLVDAWEAIKGGRNYSPSEIERWLRDHMKPAIDNARRALGREIPS